MMLEMGQLRLLVSSVKYRYVEILLNSRTVTSVSYFTNVYRKSRYFSVW